jgi:hypothetical protein
MQKQHFKEVIFRKRDEDFTYKSAEPIRGID